MYKKVTATLLAFFVITLCAEEKAANQTSIVTSNDTATSTSPPPTENKDMIKTPVVNVPSKGREGVVAPQLQSTTETLNNLTKPRVGSPDDLMMEVNISAPLSNISPRKGVTYPDLVNSSTPSALKKKPVLTVFNGNSTPNVKPSKVDVTEMVADDKEHKRAAYVIPIIAVIFSVPLVAVLMSVLYKRGSEWWQHRHFRRMDFLIEGMYNN